MAPPKLKVVESGEASAPVETLDMPTVIKIGPFLWKVVEMSELETVKSGHIGYCDSGALEIAIYPELHPQRQGEVMLHELLHACFRTGDLNLEDETTDEEKIVSVLGLQFTQVYRDNPEMFAWIDQQLGRV